MTFDLHCDKRKLNRKETFMNSLKTKLFLLFIFGLFSIHFTISKANAQIRIEITEVPYREPYAFLGIHFEFSGQQRVEGDNGLTAEAGQIGFGLRLMSAKHNQDFQFESLLDYRGIDVKKLGIKDLNNLSLFDIIFGGRYYPRYPTFGFGSVAVRFTTAAHGGLGIEISEPTLMFTVDLSAGFILSTKDNPSGLSIEFVYRPTTSNIKHESVLDGSKWEVSLKPSWCIRLGFIFGPE